MLPQIIKNKIMEQVEKINIKQIKADIKTKVELQKAYKNQRKSVKLVGKRIMSQSDATYRHFVGREDLRVLYAVYGLARGRELSYVESQYTNDNHPLSSPYFTRVINEILNSYKIMVEVEPETN